MWSSFAWIMRIAMLLTVNVIVRAVVLKVLWDWFVLPFAMLSMSAVLALGIGLLITGILVPPQLNYTDEEEDAAEDTAREAVGVVIIGAVVIALGWLLRAAS